MVQSLRWAVSVSLLTVFLVAAVSNIAMVLVKHLRREGASLIPAMGGLAGMIGVLLLPVSGAGWYWWVPLLADIGSIPLIALTLGWYGSCRIRGRSPWT